MATVAPIKLNGTRNPGTTALDSFWTAANATSFTFDPNGLVVFVRVDPTASAPTATLTIVETIDFQNRQTFAQAGISVNALWDFFVLGPFKTDGWEIGGELTMTCTGTGSGDVQVLAVKQWGAEY